MLPSLRLSPRGARRIDRLAVLALFAAPGEQRLSIRSEQGQKLRIVLADGRDSCVRQEHDRRLEAFAGVDRQHPHAFAFGLEVALDLGLVRLDLGEEPGERRRLASFVSEREREELVDRVRGVVAEPGDQRLAAALLAEQAGVEGVGAEPRGARAPFGEPARDLPRLVLVRAGQSAGERAGPVRCERVERVVVEADRAGT